MDIDLGDVETVLKETKVRMAQVPNLRDNFPEMKPILTPLLACIEKSYYTPAFS
jgi:hypothetical protein